MASNLDKYKDDLNSLVILGQNMFLDISLEECGERGTLGKKQQEAKKEVGGTFQREYQRWYTEAYSVIRQLLPVRLDEFVAMYQGEGRRKDVTSTTYTIQDWLTGVRAIVNPYTKKRSFGDMEAAIMRFNVQLEILKSLQRRFESSLFDIKQLVRADLYDSEIDAARELLTSGFLRGAGVVAGVAVETHLSQVCQNHGITTRKKNPTISDFNDMLKKNGVIDVPEWRFVQRLADLRNLCGHKRQRGPTKEEISELINGIDKMIKTLF